MSDGPLPGPRQFLSTRWSLVNVAQSDEASRTRAQMALEELCRAYWYPLYVFVRSRGHSAFDAQDLTQTFLARFIRKGGFASADRERGRFRTYLLGALKHFLANEWHRARAQKRGGEVVFLEWDALDPEARYALEPAQPTEPDAVYDREWARESITRAMKRLRSEQVAAGKGDLFETLKGALTGEPPPHQDAGERLGMTPGAVKVAVHRLRQRYRQLLRAEIAETVSDPGEIDAEMRHLLSALRKSAGSDA